MTFEAGILSREAYSEEIQKVEETGKWNPDYAVKMYLKEIGEKESDKILALFNRVKKTLKRTR